VWSNILRISPSSSLWLLDPSKAIKEEEEEEDDEEGNGGGDMIKMNVLRELGGRGISPVRIDFAPRVDKKDHILRHSQAGYTPPLHSFSYSYVCI